MTIRLVTAAAVLCAVAACEDGESRARIESLEERMIELDERTDGLAAMATAMSRLDDAADKIASLEAKVAELERKLAVGARDLRAAAPARRPGTPDPDEVYAVPIEGAPFEGPRDAKVTIVKAFEFACPFCDRVRPTLDQLRKDYKRDVRIVYKHFVVHPQTATEPALAACAAHRQGKFSQMKNALWEHAFGKRDFARANLERQARRIGLDMRKFRSDMDGACKDIVARDQQEMTRVGTRGTPAFYINGRFLSGAQPIHKFKALVDEELERANDRLRSGAKQSRYYDEWVVRNGKKSVDP